MAEETMRSPFSVGEYCANSVSSWKFVVERVLLAICDRDQEECFHDSGVLVDDALFGLFGLRLQERSLLGLSQWCSISGAGQISQRPLGHILRHLALVEEGL